MTRRKRRWAALAGVYRKAVATFYSAGGATFLADWQLTGKVSAAAARGTVVGAVAAVVTGYVPNDPAPKVTHRTRPQDMPNLPPNGPLERSIAKAAISPVTEGAPITIRAAVSPPKEDGEPWRTTATGTTPPTEPSAGSPTSTSPSPP